jgi:hypothetical protein
MTNETPAIKKEQSNESPIKNNEEVVVSHLNMALHSGESAEQYLKVFEKSTQKSGIMKDEELDYRSIEL